MYSQIFSYQSTSIHDNLLFPSASLPLFLMCLMSRFSFLSLCYMCLPFLFPRSIVFPSFLSFISILLLKIFQRVAFQNPRCTNYISFPSCKLFPSSNLFLCADDNPNPLQFKLLRALPLINSAFHLHHRPNV